MVKVRIREKVEGLRRKVKNIKDIYEVKSTGLGEVMGPESPVGGWGCWGCQ